jgi:hypothetical protein
MNNSYTRFKDGQLIATGQCLALLERYPAWHVDVEEMQFTVDL